MWTLTQILDLQIKGKMEKNTMLKNTILKNIRLKKSFSLGLVCLLSGFAQTSVAASSIETHSAASQSVMTASQNSQTSTESNCTSYPEQCAKWSTPVAHFLFFDNDNDTIADDVDPDDDNDGFLDVNDDFPKDPTEWLDTDIDGVGNNADDDDDDDGVLDVNDGAPLDLEIYLLSAPKIMIKDGSTEFALDVRWEYITNAASYRLQFFNSSTSIESVNETNWQTIDVSTATDNHTIISASTDTFYYFRSKSCPTSGECGEWSETLEYYYALPPETAPEISLLPIPARDENSDAIGSIAGEFRVDEGGQSNYKVPIYIPTGVAGIKPAIGLAYNSGGGNSQLGIGWNVSGISTISRCSKSNFIDGEFGSVNLDYEDRFCLDGQRLVLVSGEYGKSNSEYRTVMASQTKIIAKGTAGNGPSYFEVWRKDGSYNTYGNSTDSQVLANENGIVADTAHLWAQTNSQDKYGNAINYYYNEDEINGEFYIDRIEYQPNVVIQFNYNTRTDVKTGYYLGGKTQISHLLDSIVVSDDNIEVRKYELDYQQGNSDFSRLRTITESKDGVSLKPTTLVWADPIKGTQVTTEEHNGLKLRNGTFANLDGNLQPDWLYIDVSEENWINPNTGEISSPFNGGIIGTRLQSHQFDGLLYQRGCEGYVAGDIYGGRNYEVLDLNGNGRDEVIATTKNQVIAIFFDENGCLADWEDRSQVLADIDLDNKKWFFGDINGDSLPDIVYQRDNATYVKYHLGVAATEHHYFSEEQPVTFELSSFFDHEDNEFIYRTKIFAEHSSFADFNSDGRVDMLVKAVEVRSSKARPTEFPTLGPYNWIVVTSNGNNSFKEFTNLGDLGADVSKSEHVKFVDLNMDGLTDIVYRGEPQNKWHYRLFTGKAFLPAISSNINHDRIIYFGDHNLNGLTEIYYVDGSHVYSKEFNRNGTLAATAIDTGMRGENGWLFAQVDINADGELDIISVEPDEHWDHTSYDNYAYFNKNPFQGQDKINQIHNGLGGKTTITYKALTDPTQSDLYETHQGWSFDANGKVQFNARGPLYVVAKAEVLTPYLDHLNNSNSIEYRYGKQRSHSIYGGLGFEWLETIDQQTDIITRTTYSQEYPHIGSPKETHVWYQQRTDSRLLSEAHSDYEVKTVDTYIKADGTQGNIIFPYLSKSEEDSYDFDVDTLTSGQRVSRAISTTDYNNYGDPTEQNSYICSSTKIDCKSSGWLTRTQTLNSYKPADETQWIFGRLSQVMANHYRQGQTTKKRTSGFEYDDTTGILTAEIIEPTGSSNEYLRTEYKHDDFGNTTRKTVCNIKSNCAISPSDDPYENGHSFNSTLVHRTVSTEYDVNGRYPIRTKNGFNQITSEVISRNEFGQATSMMDINATITNKKYTTFGGEYFSQTATGSWSKITKALCSSLTDCPTDAKIRIQSKAAGGSVAYQFIDSLGREVKSSAISFNGDLVSTKTIYDQQGRVVQKSLPYFSDHNDESSGYSTTYYDILNRVTKIIYPDQSEDKTYYDGFDLTEQAIVTRTTNALLQQRKEYQDLAGKLIKVVDNANNVLTYQYNATNDLTSIHLNGVKQTEIEYDRLGRKVKMWDWDKGAQNDKNWSYSYNSAGELITQTDALNQTISIFYDREGRKIRQLDKNKNGVSVADAWWLFNISTVTNGYTGQLILQYDTINSELVVQPNYDQFGRNNHTRTTIDNEIFEQSITYDELGRTFQSFDASGNNHGLRSVYNEYGFLAEIREAKGGSSGTVYNKIKSMDEYGHVTREDYANGTITTRGYDDKTGRLERIVTSYDAMVPFQNIEYRWDKLGRLKYRNSIAKGLLDNFTYDELNRVDTVNGIDKFDYDAMGNITRKDGVGEYTYGGSCNGVEAGPHAVTSAGSTDYCYDFNGNVISDSERSFSYSSFNKPTQINKGNHTTLFAYAPSRSRYKRVDVQGSDTTTTYYLGGVEYIKKDDGQTLFRRNLPGAVAEVSNGVLQQINYLHVDHLGSTDIITNSNGEVVQEVSFDAFGEKRLPNNWQVKDTNINLSPLAITSKGYTGHEMAEEVGIIHMNGRIYDAHIGRFLQADPEIDGVTDSQGYNRYSYVRNNPLAYTDPTGFRRSGGLKNWGRAARFGNSFDLWGQLVNRYQWAQQVHVAGSVMCGSYQPACAAGASFHMSLINGGNMTQSLTVGARAYVTSYISMGAGGAGGGNWFAQAMVGGAVSVAQGGKFGQGFVSSLFSGAGGNNIIVSALIGGVVSEATGGKFVNGAASGAFGAVMRGIADRKSTREVTLNAPNSTNSASAEESDNYAFKYHMHKAKYGSTLPIEIIRDGANYTIQITGTVSGYKDQAESFIAAVKEIWGVSVTSPSGANFIVDINLKAISPYESGNINLSVDSAKPIEYGVSPYRANATPGGSQTNIWIDDSRRTKAHEFGHNIGFADAYKDTYGANGKVNGSYTLTNSGDIMGGSRTGGVQWYHAQVLVMNFSKKD